MHPCAKPKQDRNDTIMYTSHENDLAEIALIAPPIMSSRMDPAAKSVAMESIPALVTLVYQYNNSNTTIGRPRMKSLMISQRRMKHEKTCSNTLMINRVRGCVSLPLLPSTPSVHQSCPYVI